MPDIFIYGASGHGKVINAIAKKLNVNVVGFVDDNLSIENFIGYSVYRKLDVTKNHLIHIAIGSNFIRKKIASDDKFTPITLIDPTSIIDDSVIIGEGSSIVAGSVIQVDVKIGKHTIINTGSVIDHECEIADFVHISPNSTLSGCVKVGEGSWIGAGATIIQGVKIGKWVTVGAGAVVIKDVPDGATVVGNPARVIKIKDGY